MLPGLKTETKIHILKDISGVIKPSRKVFKNFQLQRKTNKLFKLVKTPSNMVFIHKSRMTLLLGPPGCGKTTFLLALSGKLGKSLKVYIFAYQKILVSAS